MAVAAMLHTYLPTRRYVGEGIEHEFSFSCQAV